MQNENVVFAIKRVKETFFSIKEDLYVEDPNKIVRIELGERIGFSAESNLVNFILRIFFHYQDSQEVLVDINVENMFEVEDLQRFMNEDGIFILPETLLISIVSMSLSHGRALLSKNIAGTRWQDIVLPIANPGQIAKHFYPYMFNQEANVFKGDRDGNIESQKITVNKKKKAIKKG
ncbi:MAG TPA: hypothetical protein VNS58_06355 [Puia sp.]|nr:hypothetical protein [Puia sp.]